jgi:hypothetical protein
VLSSSGGLVVDVAHERELEHPAQISRLAQRRLGLELTSKHLKTMQSLKAVNQHLNLKPS